MVIARVNREIKPTLFLRSSTVAWSDTCESLALTRQKQYKKLEATRQNRSIVNETRVLCVGLEWTELSSAET